MLKHISLLVLFGCLSCQMSDSIIREYVKIDIYTYTNENEKKAAAMPEIKSRGKLKTYTRRFEYLLINVPELHQPEKAVERNELFGLYPHRAKMKRLYLQKLSEDKNLTAYFEETLAPIINPSVEITKTFTTGELMDVSSKFFYCDRVMPDTNIQAHVCIGLNGVKEAVWEKDCVLLAAFCFEAIFNDFESETSEIWDLFLAYIKEASKKYRPTITSLDQFLLDVRHSVFEQMKNDQVLKRTLLNYYELTKNSLSFRIVD